MAFARMGRLGVCALLSCSAACAEQDELPNANQPQLHDIVGASPMIVAAAKAVVKVQHPAGGSGTGSFISADGLLLTNNHVLGVDECAREGCEIRLTFQHQKGTLSLPARKMFAVPLHVDVGLDMAVLQVYKDAEHTEVLPTPYYLELDARTAKELVGAHVFVVGHPLGRLKKWSEGAVIQAEGDWFQSSAFSLPGSSGSPILSEEGKLVGLLHRGAEGFDLLTRTSAQVTAIATAAAALQRGMDKPLPASVISVEDPLTRDVAIARRDAFLAAAATSANIDGQRASLLSLLGDGCDEGLAREDFTSIDDLQQAFTLCFAALDFIECRADVRDEATFQECPDAQRDVWRARLATINDKQRAFNGALELSAISYSIEALADSTSEGERIARDNIQAALDDSQPPFDFTLAYYLTAYGIDSYEGQSIKDFVLGYARQPFYERSAYEIAVSALWLYSADLLDRDETIKVVKKLYKDDKVSLGAKLRIEEILYNSDEL